jgi:hypothetical protein
MGVEATDIHNLTGRRFGRWVVQSYAGKDRRHLWNVVCDCGRTGVVGAYQLNKKLSQSCGCLAKDVNRSRRVVHGETSAGRRSAEFRAYDLAKNQCQNPKHPNFQKFGSKGIKFRFSSFSEFLAAVGRKNDPREVLTRVDRAGHYEAGNICWTRNRNRQT